MSTIITLGNAMKVIKVAQRLNKVTSPSGGKSLKVERLRVADVGEEDGQRGEEEVALQAEGPEEDVDALQDDIEPKGTIRIIGYPGPTHWKFVVGSTNRATMNTKVDKKPGTAMLAQQVRPRDVDDICVDRIRTIVLRANTG
uniref:DUF5641 domain-containing protein n=1 Tax=Steinernema glaseri TaxID=37863 RepID=A0A1I8ARG6_9BILA